MTPMTRTIFLMVLLTLQGGAAIADYAEGEAAARDHADSIMSEMNTTDKVNDRFGVPMTSETPMQTFTSVYNDPDQSGPQSFDTQITAPSSASFLTVSTTVRSSGNELYGLTYSQDLDFDSAADYTAQFPYLISGVCSNGLVSCSPDSYDNCTYYGWQANDQQELAYFQADQDQMEGCYCISAYCGSTLVTDNFDFILKDIGGAMVAVLLQSNPACTITDAETGPLSITYYGQMTSEGGDSAGTYFSGTSNPEDYFSTSDDDALLAAAQDELNSQADDDSSYLAQSMGSLSQRVSDQDRYNTSDSAAIESVAAGTVQVSGDHIVYEEYNPETGLSTVRTGTMPEFQDDGSCELACKVEVAATNTQTSETANTFDYQKDVSSTQVIYKTCLAGDCPMEADEVLVQDCSCLNEFAEAASLMQVLDSAVDDMACE